MKIKVRSSVVALGHDVVELDDDNATLKNLLTELSENAENGINFLDRVSGGISGPFIIRLNGEIHHFLPQGLDTRLQDGDRVEVTRAVVGGG